MRVEAGDSAGALQAYEEGLGIARRVATADPADAGWARDVVVSLFKVGSLAESSSERATAAAYYREALERSQRLVALDPGNGQWAEDRTMLEKRLAAVQEQ